MGSWTLLTAPAAKALIIPIIILVFIFGISAFGVTWSIISNAKLIAIIVGLVLGLFLLVKLKGLK